MHFDVCIFRCLLFRILCFLIQLCSVVLQYLCNLKICTFTRNTNWPGLTKLLKFSDQQSLPYSPRPLRKLDQCISSEEILPFVGGRRGWGGGGGVIFTPPWQVCVCLLLTGAKKAEWVSSAWFRKGLGLKSRGFNRSDQISVSFNLTHWQ